MFKNLSRFTKSNTGMWFIVLLIALLVIWAVMSYSNSKIGVKDNYTNAVSSVPSHPLSSSIASTAGSVAQPPANAAVSSSSGYALQPVANPKDLLPKDQNSQWGALNPITNVTPGTPFPSDLLQAGNLIGLDTISGTLRNANLDLRSDPIIQKVNIGPWNNSTIEPDLARVPLELGCGQP